MENRKLCWFVVIVPKRLWNCLCMIWNRLEDAEIHNHHFVSPIADIPKPDSFANCCDMVRELSKPFSFVRVDLYVIDGKPYFGEITFTPAGGELCNIFHKNGCSIWGNEIFYRQRFVY